MHDLNTASPLHFKADQPTAPTHPQVNRNSVLLLGKHCARLTRPLAPNMIVKGRSKRSCTRRKNTLFASPEYFSSGTACHTVCGSQAKLHDSFCVHLVRSFLPRQVLLHPAWHGFICTAWRSAAAHAHAQPHAVHAPCGEKLPVAHVGRADTCPPAVLDMRARDAKACVSGLYCP